MEVVKACRCDGTGNWIGSALTVSIDRTRYPDGYMPLAKWTRGNVMRALKAYCDMFDLKFDGEAVAGMSDGELIGRFVVFERRKRYMVGEMGSREYDAYGIDEDAVSETFRPMTDREVRRRNRNRRLSRERYERDRKEREAHGFWRKLENRKRIAAEKRKSREADRAQQGSAKALAETVSGRLSSLDSMREEHLVKAPPSQDTQTDRVYRIDGRTSDGGTLSIYSVKFPKSEYDIFGASAG